VAVGLPHPPNSAFRTPSLVGVSRKREYSRQWPETFGELATRLGNSGAPETLSRIAKARHLQAFLRPPGQVSMTSELPGWRRSADRARLQANSLLTGNFTGNFAIQGFESRFCRQEVPVLQRFFASSLRKLTGKIFRGNRETLVDNREFIDRIAA